MGKPDDTIIHFHDNEPVGYSHLRDPGNVKLTPAETLILREMGKMNGRISQLQESQKKGFEQVDARFEQVDKRFEQVDARFEQVDKRFKQVDARFDKIEKDIKSFRKSVMKAFQGIGNLIELSYNITNAKITNLSCKIEDCPDFEPIDTTEQEELFFKNLQALQKER